MSIVAEHMVEVTRRVELLVVYGQKSHMITSVEDMKRRNCPPTEKGMSREATTSKPSRYDDEEEGRWEKDGGTIGDEGRAQTQPRLKHMVGYLGFWVGCGRSSRSPNMSSEICGCSRPQRVRG